MAAPVTQRASIYGIIQGGMGAVAAESRRMIQALIANGYVREAYDEVLPMLQRVACNNAFHEWYTRDGRAVGSGTFRGEAGVLFKSIEMLRQWADDENEVN